MSRQLLRSRRFYDWTAAQSALERHEGLWPLELARVALQDAVAQRAGTPPLRGHARGAGRHCAVREMVRDHCHRVSAEVQPAGA